jgi:hypothetical protein
MTNVSTLPPSCPFCHKAFFWAGPLHEHYNKQCGCKKGKKMVTDWLVDQSLAMNDMTNPSEAIMDEVEKAE